MRRSVKILLALLLSACMVMPAAGSGLGLEEVAELEQRVTSLYQGFEALIAEHGDEALLALGEDAEAKAKLEEGFALLDDYLQASEGRGPSESDEDELTARVSNLENSIGAVDEIIAYFQTYASGDPEEVVEAIEEAAAEEAVPEEIAEETAEEAVEAESEPEEPALTIEDRIEELDSQVSAGEVVLAFLESVFTETAEDASEQAVG